MAIQRLLTRRIGSVVGLACVVAIAAGGCGGSTRAVTASAAASSASAERAAAAAASVPVDRCHTTFAVKPTKLRLPSRITVFGRTRAAGRLVAYTNTETFLLGPAGMACGGIVAADGGSQVAVWPIGKAPPARHSFGEGLTLILEPACVSCRAADSCPFFAAFAASLGFPCNGSVPAAERVDRLSSRVVYFTDAPGLYGDGWPSGGYFPATGLAGIQGSSTSGTVFRTTCTLPMASSAICAVSLLNVLHRYGTSS